MTLLISLEMYKAQIDDIPARMLLEKKKTERNIILFSQAGYGLKKLRLD